MSGPGAVTADSPKAEDSGERVAYLRNPRRRRRQDEEGDSTTMEGLLGKSFGAFLSQPKQQEPEEIIQTLCNRLQYATNLEDRRAAVLGLRGFSRDYQEV